ncbi:MAG: hypothetical protein GY829_01870 [Gammaproteobacteria bacterium]|nr:hypothetical protein [Gammaproteobacteria bacterium]
MQFQRLISDIYQTFCNLRSKIQKLILVIPIILMQASCGSGGSGDDEEVTPSVNITPTLNAGNVELIGHAFSGTSIGLSWLKNNATYSIYRNNIIISETSENFYIDANLQVNTEYIYSITTGDVNDESVTSTIIVTTLINDTNAGNSNGSRTEILNDRLENFGECNNERNALNVADEILDTCLRAMLNHNEMVSDLENMRAFAARVRSEQTAAMVELGMRLFHNKSLSVNGDTACSSCHHPAIGCGSDGLSLPIGVNTVDPALLGQGRTDGVNIIPIIPRNSPATCNTSLWTRGLFWDNRVALQGIGLTTDSTDVTNNTILSVGDNSTLTLLAAQSNFPVTSSAEMGDITQFGYDETDITEHTSYRETILAGNLSTIDWGDLFQAAFGNTNINYSKIAEAIAAYEAVQIFINNPFFDYVDGNDSALSIDEKRGAITFMAGSTGCTFCHSGAFFSTQAPLPANYPQIGPGTDPEGTGSDEGAVGRDGTGAFRAPTLLNVAITGPWGHNGQFSTLKRNVEHYQGHGDSIRRYFADNEMCELEQFSDLPDCAAVVAPNGLALSETILAGNEEFSNRISDAEVDLVVQFLGTLTDPDAADINSNAIQALIPTRDSGPDGQQLDARDQLGNEL